MNIRNNNLKQLKSVYVTDLSDLYGVDEAEQLMTILIEHLFEVSRYQLVMEPDIRLSESEIVKLHMAVKELKMLTPVQYITGRVEFMGHNYIVDPSVLIPRPETEELVHLILDNENGENLKILDVGTGSGCIAISLYLKMVNSIVVACDYNQKALDTAVLNSEVNGAEVDFKRLNILDKNSKIEHKSVGQDFDIIVSNPPYVTSSERSKMNDNVLNYEPHDALFVPDEDPLIFYDAILHHADLWLKAGGRLYFEINENLGNETLHLIREKGYKQVRLFKDLFDKDRFIQATKSSE